MTKYTLLKVGSDAELFLLKAGNPFPVCGLVGGTKQDPLPVLEGNGYAVQEDNVSLEFNIPPASTAVEFQESICKMLDYLQEEMAKKELQCFPVSELKFPHASLSLHPQAYTFGCEPDYCVWTRSVNPTPEFPHFLSGNPKSPHEIRVAGYHIHVSYLVDDAKPTLEAMENLVKAQDVFLGIPLVPLELASLQSKTTPRRSFYGKAGAFRPKEYGHEYRVLGSSVLSKQVALNQWIFEANQRAIKFLNEAGADGIMKLNQQSLNIRAAINDSHMSSVRQIMEIFPGANVPVPFSA